MPLPAGGDTGGRRRARRGGGGLAGREGCSAHVVGNEESVAQPCRKQERQDGGETGLDTEAYAQHLHASLLHPQSGRCSGPSVQVPENKPFVCDYIDYALEQVHVSSSRQTGQNLRTVCTIHRDGQVWPLVFTTTAAADHRTRPLPSSLFITLAEPPTPSRPGPSLTTAATDQ